LFEDHRARLVGDTITVQIVEKISATQKSTSSIDKSGKLSAGVTALPGISPNSFGRATAAATSSTTFDGKGSTENSNDFSGTITATVTGATNAPATGSRYWKSSTRYPATVTADEDVSVVALRMMSLGIRHLPVVDAQAKPVGLLSARNLVAVLDRARP